MTLTFTNQARATERVLSLTDPALFVTLKLALLTTLALALIGLPLAYWLARTTFRYRWLVESVVSMPLILPPTVLGFYLLLLFGRHGLGEWVRLPFTFTGILIGSIVFNSPLAIRPFTAAFLAVPKSLEEASWCLGRSRWQTFLRVVLPLSAPGILAGCANTFANTLGEFGVVLMLGGNIPGETRTMSIAIYDQIQGLDYAGANRSAITLVIISACVLIAMHVLSHRLRPKPARRFEQADR